MSFDKLRIQTFDKFDISIGRHTIYKSDPDLNIPLNENRICKCCACGETTYSNPELPHFEPHHGELLDSYYCGCQG